MRSGQAIIGANYGDEGKGLMTDYFASQSKFDTTVIRFNGGAQAGHTVVTPDGKRHVFSHIGSGSFQNIPTYLSEFFIVNPMMFVKEIEELKLLGIDPCITISGDAFLSTPIDMMLNQIVELSRGKNRHGSCGLGINETVTRCLRNEVFLTRASDLLRPNNLANKLYLLQRDWLRQRLGEFGVDFDSALGKLQLHCGTEDVEKLYCKYLSDVESMLEVVQISNKLPDFSHYIFEGAQGLLLDENRRDLFPHVTRSRTGINNVLELCEKLDVDDLTVTYVTRSYLTRHGAGPLTGETNFSFVDQTNVTNRFQGNLRFAPMNYDLISNSIDLDLSTPGTYPAKFEANLAVTCLDQIDKCGNFPIPVHYQSYGPSLNDIEVRSFACA